MIHFAESRLPGRISQSQAYGLRYQRTSFHVKRQIIFLTFSKRYSSIPFSDDPSFSRLGRSGHRDQQGTPVLVINQLLSVRIHIRCRGKAMPSRHRIRMQERNTPSIRGSQDPTDRIVRTVQGRHPILKAPVLYQFRINTPIHRMVDFLNSQTIQLLIHRNCQAIPLHQNRRCYWHFRLTAY